MSAKTIPGNDIQVFWRCCKVDLDTPVVNGSHCRIWQRARDAYGYGNLWNGHRQEKAHRHVYEATKGPVPEGKIIRHMCNNGHLGCVEPLHLAIGTMKDNSADMIRAGHVRRGEKHYRANLTKEQIHEIRKLKSEGKTYSDIAERYGISTMWAWRIANRKGWGWLS